MQNDFLHTIIKERVDANFVAVDILGLNASTSNLLTSLEENFPVHTCKIVDFASSSQGPEQHHLIDS